MKLKVSCFFALLSFSFTFISLPAEATGKLIVYCSAQITLCEAQTKAFSEKYEVKTSFIRNSSGSQLARLDAEKNNPRADIWYGGTLDFHSQAAEMGLLEAYKSPLLVEINPKFRDPGKIKGNFSSAIYIGILGFGVNTQRLRDKNLPIPRCWTDLLNPIYKNEIQIADPQSSGTAYTALATFEQLWGNKQAFDYQKMLHKNIVSYSKSGITPARNAAKGEISIGIGFLHDYAQEKENNAPLELIVPCEGTGYEIGGISIVKGARNEENAKKFIDWVLSKESQELTWKQAKSYQILTNMTAISSPLSLRLTNLPLINYDMDTYGSAEKRQYLINEWLTSIKTPND